MRTGVQSWDRGTERLILAVEVEPNIAEVDASDMRACLGDTLDQYTTVFVPAHFRSFSGSCSDEARSRDGHAAAHAPFNERPHLRTCTRSPVSDSQY